MKKSKKKYNEITQKEFLKQINKHKKGYMKKKGSWQKITFWWESKDKWFMNKSIDTRKGGEVTEQPSSWLTPNGFKEQINFLNRLGYNYYELV